MLNRNNKTPVKTKHPTVVKITQKSPTPIPHVTSTMLPDPNQNNLNIALQLAQHHKKQAYIFKEKCAILQAKLKQKQNIVENFESKLQSVHKDNQKLVKKYKKLKKKYKVLQQEQQINEIQQKCKNQTSKRNQDQQQPSPIFQKYKEINTQTNPNTQCISLMQDLSQKNRTISLLCQKVEECQENTLQIFKLVSVLQQRVQELSMDNNLLRGVVRQQCRIVSANSRQVTLD